MGKSYMCKSYMTKSYMWKSYMKEGRKRKEDLQNRESVRKQRKCQKTEKEHPTEFPDLQIRRGVGNGDSKCIMI